MSLFSSSSLLSIFSCYFFKSMTLLTQATCLLLDFLLALLDRAAGGAVACSITPAEYISYEVLAVPFHVERGACLLIISILSLPKEHEYRRAMTNPGPRNVLSRLGPIIFLPSHLSIFNLRIYGHL